MPLSVTDLIARLDQAADSLTFADIISAIDAHYLYTPQTFSNGLGEGMVINPAGTNQGSCKVLAFGLLNNLSVEHTLACFAEHYRDVLAQPAGTSHANIRTFMRDGWAGIRFEGDALVPKT